jgi:hypothetical protein
MEDWSAVTWKAATATAAAALADPWLLLETLTEEGGIMDGDACIALPGTKGMSSLLQMLQNPAPAPLTDTTGFISQSSQHSSGASAIKTELGLSGLARNAHTLSFNPAVKHTPVDDGMPMKPLSSILGGAAAAQAAAMMPPQNMWSIANLKGPGIAGMLHANSDSAGPGIFHSSSSSIGQLGGSSSSTSAPPAKPLLKPAPADPMSSGMLDMSAFGLRGSFDPHDAEDTQDAEDAVSSVGTLSSHLHVALNKPAAVSTSLLETGVFDMAAFRLSGKEAAPETPPNPPPMSPFPPPPPPPPILPAPSPSPAQPSALDTGMIDMSAFGFGAAPSKEPGPSGINWKSPVNDDETTHDERFQQGGKGYMKLLLFPRLLEQPAPSGLSGLLLDAGELGDLLNLLLGSKQV